MTYPTLIKFPSRGRHQVFQKTFARWDVPGVHFLVTLDKDDPSLPHYWSFLDGRPNVTIRVGYSRTKVQAINDGVAETDWEFLILAADDFLPQRADYATFLRDSLYRAFPDGDGVVWPNDGRVGRALNTTAVMGRKYFNRTGRIYDTEYVSVFCDDELTEVSKRLGLYVWLDEVVLKHEWTDATGRDALHLRNESFYDRDSATFKRRRAAGFPVAESLGAGATQ